MVPFDGTRFGYALAGVLLAGEWTARALQAGLRESSGHQALAKTRLPGRVLQAFPARPEFYALVGFLRSDRGLWRTLRSGRGAAGAAARTEKPPVRLRGITIPELPTEAALAEWLGVDPQALRWRADISGRNRKHPAGPLRTFRYRWIPRREGLPRLLEIPKGVLKQMQRRVLAEILDPVPVHRAAHGFRAGRSIVTNAAAHCGKATVLRFDLADFFATVTAARVFRIFRTLGYPDHVSRLLTGLCTTCLPADVWEARPGGRLGADFLAGQRFMTRHLPQGAPTSPALANLAAGRLDRRLSGLASAVGAVYTRFADDLIFSGGVDLARRRKRLETLVAVMAHEEGFAVNHRKTRIMRAGVRQQVTGVVVNVLPNIRREEFDRLKAIFTNCARHGPASQNREHVLNFRSHLAGKVAQVASIHARRGEKLAQIFRRIQWKAEPNA